MSGGYFNHNYSYENMKWDIFGLEDKPSNAFDDREISELVWDVFELIHDFDWYKSGDTCEETYLEKKKEFKKKWFEAIRKDRIKRIVDETFNETKEELYRTFGLGDKNE